MDSRRFCRTVPTQGGGLHDIVGLTLTMVHQDLQRERRWPELYPIGPVGGRDLQISHD